jgi:predicted transcriptional regulator of viral defense system
MTTTAFLRTHPVFRFEEFRSSHAGRSPLTTHAALRGHVERGNLVRVRRGLYATVPPCLSPDSAPVDPYLLATRLTPDAVVAHHAALQFHGKAYSLWSRFPFLTAERAGRFAFRGADFVPVRESRNLRGSPDRGGGVETLRHAGGTVRVTTLERTLVDIMDAPGKSGGWEEVLRSLEMVEYFRLEEVVAYAERLGSAVAAARTGWFLERHREALMVEEAWLARFERLRPRQPRYLDGSRAPGRLLPRWNLVVPPGILDRSWEEPA